MKWSLCLAGALALAACGSSNPTVDAGSTTDAGSVDAGPIDAGPEFEAVTADIANYFTWTVVTIPDGDTGEGTRYVYVNQLPPHGSTTWPTGTILVKESQTFGIHAGITIDAMVKRGGAFNPDIDGGYPDGGYMTGAHGWEWMGLNRIGDAGATIGWRGTVPPPNAGYGPLNGDCNGCHTQATTNDDVKVPADDAGYHAAFPLMLSNY